MESCERGEESSIGEGRERLVMIFNSVLIFLFNFFLLNTYFFFLVFFSSRIVFFFSFFFAYILLNFPQIIIIGMFMIEYVCLTESRSVYKIIYLELKRLSMYSCPCTSATNDIQSWNSKLVNVIEWRHKAQVAPPEVNWLIPSHIPVCDFHLYTD